MPRISGTSLSEGSASAVVFLNFVSELNPNKVVISNAVDLSIPIRTAHIGGICVVIQIAA